MILGEGQAAKAEDAGVDLEVKTVDGLAASAALRLQAAEGWDVFRSYSEPGGIKDELLATASEHTDIVKLVIIGQTSTARTSCVLKVTKNANADQGRQAAGGALRRPPSTPASGSRRR